MNWRCRLGLHCWEEVDTDESLEKFAESQGIEEMCRPVRVAFESPIGDFYCPRCGKLDLSDLEANKAFLLMRESKYVYKNGKVVEI